MTIDKFDPTWAESGDKTPTPTDEKIDTGWVGGDRPREERFNYLQNRVEEKINRIQRERADSFYSEATDAQLMLSTGQWTESWGTTRDALNLIDGGDKAYKATCLTFSSNNEPQLLVFDDSLMKIEKWDCRTLALLDTSDALTDDLPAVGTELWQGVSMCTDGTSVYLMFRDTFPANDTYQIQAWDIATWDVKATWAAVSLTGTALTGSGSPGTQLNGKIIIASPTRLATCNVWNTVVNNATESIEIINIATGAIVASGAGDAAAGTLEHPAICSDGTNIFFGNVVGGNAVINSATIADPTTGLGGATAYPRTLDAGFIYSLTACGPDLIISSHYHSAPAPADYVLRTHSATKAVGDSIIRGDNSQGMDGDEYIAYQIINATFDGINYWALAMIDNATSYSAALLKIDVSKFIQFSGVDKFRQLEDIVSGCFMINTNIDVIIGADLFHSNPVFDGRDMWVAPEPDDGELISGHIYRLPLAMLRS